MAHDVYAPPQADLQEDSEEANLRFYVVSKKKLAVLFLATLGVFSVYWFYVNWRNFKAITGDKIWPIPRAIFYIFFTHSLFAKVDEDLKAQKIEYDWSPGALALGVVLFSIASNVLDRLAQREIWSPLTDVLALATLPFIMFFLLKAQEAINLSQNDASGSSNNKFTIYNILWIVLGVLFWMLVAVGMLEMLGVISLDF